MASLRSPGEGTRDPRGGWDDPFRKQSKKSDIADTSGRSFVCPAVRAAVSLRAAHAADMRALRAHCLEVFPVRYNADFYTDMIDTGVTVVAMSHHSPADLTSVLPCPDKAVARRQHVAGAGAGAALSSPESTSNLDAASVANKHPGNDNSLGVDDIGSVFDRHADCVVPPQLSVSPSLVETERQFLLGEVMVRLEEEDLAWLFRAAETCCGLNFTRRAYIATLSVDDHLRRHGLASLLLEEAISKLKQLNVCQVSLHVKADNVAAINFYKKHGFYIRARLARHYFIDDKFEDALLMILVLTPSHLDDLYVGRRAPNVSLSNFWWRIPEQVAGAVSALWNADRPSSLGAPSSNV
jgi:ribosomal protein S18 acetylase RimI-like enzyme